MLYLFVAYQKSEGCDYTIGCGIKTFEVEADSKEAALKKVITILFDDHGCVPNSDNEIDVLRCYEVKEKIEVDMDAINEEYTFKARTEELLCEKERAEKALEEAKLKLDKLNKKQK